MMKCTGVLKGVCHDPESRGLRLKRPGINTYVAVRLFLSNGVTRHASVSAVENSNPSFSCRGKRDNSDYIAVIQLECVQQPQPGYENNTRRVIRSATLLK